MVTEIDLELVTLAFAGAKLILFSLLRKYLHLPATSIVCCDFNGVAGIATFMARYRLVTAATSELNLGCKKESIGGAGRAVFVLPSPPKIFNAEIDRFIGVPNEISGDVVGVIVCIPTEKPWIVGVYIAVNQV